MDIGKELFCSETVSCISSRSWASPVAEVDVTLTPWPSCSHLPSVGIARWATTSSQEDFSHWENLKFELFILLSVLETVSNTEVYVENWVWWYRSSFPGDRGRWTSGQVFIASTRPARAMEWDHFHPLPTKSICWYISHRWQKHKIQRT